jgi:integrase
MRHPEQMPMVVLLNGIFRRARRVWKLPVNPIAEVERLTTPKRSGIEFYSPEEVHALVRCASSPQDRVLFLTAALTGLRMGELLALRWRDVDFEAQTIRVLASYTAGGLGTPKSGQGRAVPPVEEAARALARLGTRKRLCTTSLGRTRRVGCRQRLARATRTMVASRIVPRGCPSRGSR